jgi:lysophospholipase L1-like esterase
MKAITLLAAVALASLVLGAAAEPGVTAKDGPSTQPAPVAEQRVYHILPLGDSITQGGRLPEEYTYRWPLHQLLVDAGVRHEFVGSMTAGLVGEFKFPEEYKGQKFDPHHEGHYGWKTAAVRDHLAEWSKSWTHAPDIALIHLGTNDQGSKDFKADIIEPLTDIVRMLREKNPRVVVLLGHLNFNGGAALEIRKEVEELARTLSTPDSPVATVHHYASWSEAPNGPHSDTFDWAHPNPAGQQKMAQAWYNALRPYVGK